MAKNGTSGSGRGKAAPGRWARLGSMQGEEILDRARQTFLRRWDLARYRLGFGFDDLAQRGRPVNPQFVFQPQQLPDLLSALRQDFPGEVEQIRKRAERICLHRFDLLGYRDLDYGRKIKWHCDVVHGKCAPRKPWFRIRYLDFDEVGDIKITWELNRHQHLVTLAKAFRLDNDKRFAEELFCEWYDWVAENPYPTGVNWASSLEVSFRALSWLWIRYLLADSPAVPKGFERQLLRALAVHGRHIESYLSTYFSANTHLLGEGVALFFLGTLCPQVSRASRWQRKGWNIVLGQAQRQVQSDGMHFENSTYYHVYALDLFLHARILAACNGISVPPVLDRTIEKMLSALADISQGGIVPRFGDDDGGRLFDPSRNGAEHLLDPLATGAVLFNRHDFATVPGNMPEETLWLVGRDRIERFQGTSPIPRTMRSLSLPEEGLYVMANDSSMPSQLIIDAGPQGKGTAGHSHADALSIQVSCHGRQLLIDPGTFEYVGEGSERDRFRGTSAHNTLQIDGCDQAEPAGPFRWTCLPEVEAKRWQTGDKFDFFAGRVSTRGSSPKASCHHRYVFQSRSRFWLVRDLVTGNGQHRLDVCWLLGPHLTISKAKENLFLASDESTRLALIAAAEPPWRSTVESGCWSPVYGRKEPTALFRLSTDTKLPAELATLIILRPHPAQLSLGEFVKLPEHSASCGVSAYRYSEPGRSYRFFFPCSGQPWRIGPWMSDAEFLYYGSGIEDGSRELIFVQGSYVDFQGTRLVHARQAVSQCEILFENGRTRVLTPQREPVEICEFEAIVPSDVDASETCDVGSGLGI